MENKKQKIRFWLLIIFLLITLDQATKFIANTFLVWGKPVYLFPFFNFDLAFNTGAAFSILQSGSGWQRWFFILLAICVSSGLLIWLYQLPTQARFKKLAISMIISGALGNAIDRIFYGFVIDFIDLHLKHWHWPTFNVADSLITIGALFLIISVLREKNA